MSLEVAGRLPTSLLVTPGSLPNLWQLSKKGLLLPQPSSFTSGPDSRWFRRDRSCHSFEKLFPVSQVRLPGDGVYPMLLRGWGRFRQEGCHAQRLHAAQPPPVARNKAHPSCLVVVCPCCPSFRSRKRCHPGLCRTPPCLPVPGPGTGFFLPLAHSPGPLACSRVSGQAPG